MTLTALHSSPPRRAVAIEQVRALTVSLRKEAWVFAIAWVLFLALGLRAAFASLGDTHAYIRVTLAPGTTFPMVVMALFIPLSVWRSEDPSRRAYHWTMPLPRSQHTMLKVAAGLVWAFGALVLYIACVGILSASIGLITGRWERYDANVWEWLVPFTACAITYASGSAVAVGVRHPSRWLLGVIPASLMIYLFAKNLGLLWLQDTFITLWQGKYGLMAALGADVGDIGGQPSFTRWGIATLAWGIPALLLLLIAARRHMEEN